MNRLSMWTALAAVSVMGAGCSLQKQTTPALSGPSEFGLSLSVAADKDRLPQDGVSQVGVNVTARDDKGQPKPDVLVQWNITASNGALVEPSEQQTKTNAQGIARIVVTAPPAPAVVPTSDAKLTISAKPVNGDALSTNNSRTIVVMLVPPAGTLLPNRNPVPVFTIAPAIGNIMQELLFDASQTTDEGEPCPACSYQWDFGDFLADSGKIVRHSYERPATYTVTLTVTDARGGVGSTTKSLTISGPAAPVASFTVSPATVASGGQVVFNAAGTTIGAGGKIEEYQWDFGDGNTQTTDLPIVAHTYTNAGPGNKVMPVVLTVKDNYGRKSVATGVVTVTP